MYCSQCGKEVKGNVRYCPVCGTRQEMRVMPAEDMIPKDLPAQKKKQKAHRQGRRLGNFLVSVIALLILFSGEDTVPALSDYTFQRMDVSCFAVQGQREMAICDAKGNFCLIDLPQQILYSADHSRLAYVDRDRELYYMDDTDPVFVDDGVRDAGLSFYGDAIVYVRDGDGSRDELCVYTIRTESLERLKVSDCRSFCISPDGKHVACMEAGSDGTLVLWQPGSEAAKITGRVSEVLSLSENGEMLLYRKDGDKLFRYLNGKEEQAASAGGTMDYVLNEEQDEILYTAEGSTWYYSMNLKEPVRLAGVKGNLLTTCYMTDTACQQGQGLTLGRKTLKNLTFATHDVGGNSCKLYRLNWNGKEAEPILNYAEQFRISKDGRSVLYLSDRKLYQIRDIGSSQDRECISGAMDVSQFTADADLGKIWFSTSGRELYYVKNKECLNVSYDLDRMQGCVKDGILFQEGQDLYFSDGAEKVLVKSGVEEAWIRENDYVVIKSDEGLCYLKDLKDSVCLMGGS